jgi:broad specificity phosphatase PhoE
MELLLIRHGESNYNTRSSKHLDSKLTKRGQKQCEEAADFILRSFDDLSGWQGLVSPYYRTLCTANVISKATNIPFKAEWAVREFGDKGSGYEKRTILRIPDRRHIFPNMFQEIPLNPEWTHGFETSGDLMERLIDFLSNLEKDGKYMVVSHGMPIYTMINILNGCYNVPQWDKKILNTSITYFVDNECRYFAKFVNSGSDPRGNPSFKVF